jgi:hypothetical protein
LFPLNVPNVLTVLRILLVPVLVVALTTQTKNGDTIAAVVFAIAAFTDGLDGYIARSRRAITTFGKVMDPIADKMLITAALISLVSLDRLAAWVAMVIIAREFAVSSLRVAAAHHSGQHPREDQDRGPDCSRDGADRREQSARDVGRRARRADGRGDRCLGPGLLPQPQARDRARAREPARSASDSALRHRDQPLQQLLAGSAADIERAVERAPIRLQHGEQNVDRPNPVGVAEPGHADGAKADDVDRVRFGGGNCRRKRRRTGVGHQRCL